MTKKAFLIRGFKFGTSAADPDFMSVRAAIQECGYEVIPVPWTWNFKTLSQYADKFVDFYVKNKGEYNVVIGHSFGAMVALASASRTKPDLLVLCSLSGYFKEDLPKYTKTLLSKTPDLAIKRIGQRPQVGFRKAFSGKNIRRSKAARYKNRFAIRRARESYVTRTIRPRKTNCLNPKTV